MRAETTNLPAPRPNDVHRQVFERVRKEMGDRQGIERCELQRRIHHLVEARMVCERGQYTRVAKQLLRDLFSMA